VFVVLWFWLGLLLCRLRGPRSCWLAEEAVAVVVVVAVVVGLRTGLGPLCGFLWRAPRAPAGVASGCACGVCLCACGVVGR
jgi:hypothetical protein